MKKYLFLLSAALLLTSCQTPLTSDNSSAETSISDITTSPEGGVSSTSSSNTIEDTQSIIPEVGEVRKWFDHGVPGEDYFYNYCPSTIVEDNVKHIYYCTNKEDGNVTDYIGYRKATYEDNKWKYSDEKLVLQPTSGTWDARHTCDPAVVKGTFGYKGENYSYLMAYLGCVTSDNSLNETGIALAKTPSGPWIKCDSNPLVPYDLVTMSGHWGTGQPDVININGESQIIVFVTCGTKNGSYTMAYEYDLSDCEHPRLIRNKKLPTYGLLSDGGPNFIVNSTFAYDNVNKKFLMAKPRNPYGLDDREPSFIASKIDLYYIDDSSSTNPGDELFQGANAKNWHHMGLIDKDLTGFDRNHNNGIVKNAFGHIVSNERIEVAFTRSDLAQSFWGYLSTYRIYSTAFNLKYE